MSGPPPNPNARRRNVGAGWTKLSGPRVGPVPPLPGRGWRQATRSAWRAWWKSPQATQWSESDVPSLLLMARMFDLALGGDDKQAASEFRQWTDRFGLSLSGRLRNRMLVDIDAEDVAKTGSASKAATAATVIRLRPGDRRSQ
jgi:hypothetical protein